MGYVSCREDNQDSLEDKLDQMHAHIRELREAPPSVMLARKISDALERADCYLAACGKHLTESRSVLDVANRSGADILSENEVLRQENEILKGTNRDLGKRIDVLEKELSRAEHARRSAEMRCRDFDRELRENPDKLVRMIEKYSGSRDMALHKPEEMNSPRKR